LPGIKGNALTKNDLGINAENTPKFKEVWTDIQARMGKRPDKPREIKKTLGKDDFLKIMIMQMQHQDPTKPFDADKMAAEMAQITSVEQLKNVNTNLNKMSNQNKPLEKLAMTHLIGKTVTLDQSRFSHIKGDNRSLGYDLTEDLNQVKVSVVSPASGEVIFTKDVGGIKSGRHSFLWSGKKDNTVIADSGTYLLKVEGVNNRGENITVKNQGRQKVIGVSFVGEEPVLLVGNSKSQNKISMKNIVKIEDGSIQVQNEPKKTGNSSNFFTFKKGEGSKNLDVSALSSDERQAIKQYEKSNNIFGNSLENRDNFDVNLKQRKGGDK